MEAITVKYLGATNHRGARVIAVAKDAKQRVEISWDYAANAAVNYRRAAILLASRLGWIGQWIGTMAHLTAHSAIWVFVNVDTASESFDITLPANDLEKAGHNSPSIKTLPWEE